MSIAKPFNFTANTYAKASEVNADFDVLYAQVNKNISDIAKNALDIESVGDDKADINGSPQQRFSVADPVGGSEAVNKNYLLTHCLPVGFIAFHSFYDGETVPTGWLVCDGKEVSKTQYADLYSVIGDTFGEAEDNNSFVIPDLIDKFVQGSTTVGTEKEAGLPDHNHSYRTRSRYGKDASGSSYAWWCRGDAGDGYATGTFTNASESNPIYGNSDTVQPPAVTFLPLIKY
jgi:hypothetical protein